MAKQEKIKVQCQECGKKFSTAKIIPECPRCGGADIEPRDESSKERVEAYGVKGMKSKPWQRIFRNTDAMLAWVEKNDAEVRGTRNPD